MKVDFYLSVYQGQTSCFFPSETQPIRYENQKVLKFSVDIPMEQLFPVDTDLGQVAIVEITKDRE